MDRKIRRREHSRLSLKSTRPCFHSNGNSVHAKVPTHMERGNQPGKLLGRQEVWSIEVDVGRSEEKEGNG